MYSVLDLPKQYNNPGLPYIAFSAAEVMPMAASTQMDKGTWSLGPLTIIHPAPRPWLFVEGSKPTISLGGQHKPDVTHVLGRANENGVSIYGTAHMALDFPGVEQKPHDGNNHVTALVDSGPSGNYISNEEMLPDVRDYVVALHFNVDIPADRGDVHSQPTRGGRTSPIIFTVVITDIHTNVRVGIRANICPGTGGTKSND